MWVKICASRVQISFCYWKRKDEVKHADGEEASFLCQLDRSLSSLDVVLRRLDFDFDATRLG